MPRAERYKETPPTFTDSCKKTLDAKLARIVANPSCGDFILADAKDADMASGISALGAKCDSAGERVGYRSVQEFRDQIREIVAQNLVDIIFLSVSTSDVLVVHERHVDNSPIRHFQTLYNLRRDGQLGSRRAGNPDSRYVVDAMEQWASCPGDRLRRSLRLPE